MRTEMGQKAKNRAIDAFDWETEAQKYVAAYILPALQKWN
jgi:hypothetical protein